MLQEPDRAVSAETLNGDLKIPEVATTILRKYHALMYHVPSGTYRFYSPTFLHAARKLLNKT
jgi:hypothetical protein